MEPTGPLSHDMEYQYQILVRQFAHLLQRACTEKEKAEVRKTIEKSAMRRAARGDA